MTAADPPIYANVSLMSAGAREVRSVCSVRRDA
jgi:hypothetical protein